MRRLLVHIRKSFEFDSHGGSLSLLCCARIQEELGIDLNKIVQRILSVLNPMKKVTTDMITSRSPDGQVRKSP